MDIVKSLEDTEKCEDKKKMYITLPKMTITSPFIINHLLTF